MFLILHVLSHWQLRKFYYDKLNPETLFDNLNNFALPKLRIYNEGVTSGTLDFRIFDFSFAFKNA